MAQLSNSMFEKHGSHFRGKTSLHRILDLVHGHEILTPQEIF